MVPPGVPSLRGRPVVGVFLPADTTECATDLASAVQQGGSEKLTRRARTNRRADTLAFLGVTLNDRVAGVEFRRNATHGLRRLFQHRRFGIRSNGGEPTDARRPLEADRVALSRLRIDEQVAQGRWKPAHCPFDVRRESGLGYDPTSE